MINAACRHCGKRPPADPGSRGLCASCYVRFRDIYPKSCRHCGKIPANRPRQLCRICWMDMSIRTQYETLSKYGRRIETEEVKTRHDYPLPLTPTSAQPGSEEKIQVMAHRYECGQAIFHPLDQPDLR